MNNRTLILACCALVGLSAGAARAQLEVSLTLDQGVYIVGEPVRADVVIVNHFPAPFGIGPGDPIILDDIKDVAIGSGVRKAVFNFGDKRHNACLRPEPISYQDRTRAP